MSIQESIRRILKEERKLSNSLIRRLGMLDYEVKKNMKGPLTGSSICIFFKSNIEYFESIMENSIDFMYYNHFSHIDDNSGEWAHTYLDMVDYIRKKYKNKIMKNYDDNCGSRLIPLKESIRRVLREDTEIKSNYQKVIDKFKKILPKEYSEKVDEVFGYIKDFINKEGFNLKVLNNCQVPFKGTRTKDFIIICSPELYNSLPDLIYIIFHEIRHEIQMGTLGQINPLSGDLEDFDELYKMYWEMEMDAHKYAIEWVNKIGNMINLPKEYYKLSPMVTSYPSMGHMVRDQIVNINKIIKELKQKGYDYSDISDLPFVKKHLDKLEDLF